MRDASFLIAGVLPLLRKNDFGAYQLESKDFWEGDAELGNKERRFHRMIYRPEGWHFVFSYPCAVYQREVCQPEQQDARQLTPMCPHAARCF